MDAEKIAFLFQAEKSAFQPEKPTFQPDKPILSQKSRFINLRK
jgi:hypothetical protein